MKLGHFITSLKAILALCAVAVFGFVFLSACATSTSKGDVLKKQEEIKNSCEEIVHKATEEKTSNLEELRPEKAELRDRIEKAGCLELFQEAEALDRKVQDIHNKWKSTVLEAQALRDKKLNELRKEKP